MEEKFEIISVAITSSAVEIVLSDSKEENESAQKITVHLNKTAADEIQPLAIVYLKALHDARSVIDSEMRRYGHLLSQNRAILRQQDQELLRPYLTS